MSNAIYLKALIVLLIGLMTGKLYQNFFAETVKKDFIVSLNQKYEEKKEKNREENKNNIEQEKPKPKMITVTIKGAVKMPGTYQMPIGSNLYDLVKKAGGFLPGADEKIKNYYLKNGSEFTIKFRKIIVVEILGEVNKPGKYEMYQGDRLSDLIKKAGGLTLFGNAPKKDYYLKDGATFTIYKTKKQGEHYE